MATPMAALDSPPVPSSISMPLVDCKVGHMPCSTTYKEVSRQARNGHNARAGFLEQVLRTGKLLRLLRLLPFLPFLPLLVLVLQLIQLEVNASLGEELLVGARLAQVSLVQ